MDGTKLKSICIYVVFAPILNERNESELTALLSKLVFPKKVRTYWPLIVHVNNVGYWWMIHVWHMIHVIDNLTNGCFFQDVPNYQSYNMFSEHFAQDMEISRYVSVSCYHWTLIIYIIMFNIVYKLFLCTNKQTQRLHTFMSKLQHHGCSPEYFQSPTIYLLSIPHGDLNSFKINYMKKAITRLTALRI